MMMVRPATIFRRHIRLDGIFLTCRVTPDFATATDALIGLDVGTG